MIIFSLEARITLEDSNEQLCFDRSLETEDALWVLNDDWVFMNNYNPVPIERVALALNILNHFENDIVKRTKIVQQADGKYLAEEAARTGVENSTVFERVVPLDEDFNGYYTSVAIVEVYLFAENKE